MKSTVVLVSGVLMVAASIGVWSSMRPGRSSVDGVELCNEVRAGCLANDLEPVKKKRIGSRVSFTGKLVNIKYDITTNAYEAMVILSPSFVNGIEKINAMTLLFPPNDKRNFEAAKTSPTQITAQGIIERISDGENAFFIIVKVDPQ
jgi:hypothetical protein